MRSHEQWLESHGGKSLTWSTCIGFLCTVPSFATFQISGSCCSQSNHALLKHYDQYSSDSLPIWLVFLLRTFDRHGSKEGLNWLEGLCPISEEQLLPYLVNWRKIERFDIVENNGTEVEEVRTKKKSGRKALLWEIARSDRSDRP